MLATDKPRAALAGIHIFAGLREEALDTLAERCQERPVVAGELVVEENVLGREMFLIGEGRIRIINQRGLPGEKVLAELGGGEFFGEMSVIECTRRSASAVALTAGTLYALSNSDIHRLFKQWPDQFAILILNISRDLCRRLRAMNRLFTPGPGQLLHGCRTGV